MTALTYTIRTMSRSEINIAIDWAASEGWNPGLHDAGSFYATDPEGFLVGELDGNPIATISVVKYGETFGFLGFYIVKPEFRGLGYGFRIWEAGMAQLAGRNIGLDGVVDQQDNYRKSGFRLAYRNIRYEGTTGRQPVGQHLIVGLGQVPFEIIHAYDAPFFPDDRRTFLKAWLRQPGSVALGVLKGKSLAGYGMIRACQKGYKVGPLFADDPDVAEVLFCSLTSRVKSGEPVYLDVPEVNRAAVSLAERHCMSVVFETARMYTGTFPGIPTDRLFGVTTFELG